MKIFSIPTTTYSCSFELDYMAPANEAQFMLDPNLNKRTYEWDRIYTYVPKLTSSDDATTHRNCFVDKSMSEHCFPGQLSIHR